MKHIVVIGAGQAGLSLVAALRSGGFGGNITLLGKEPVPPYQRPPLSKAYLLGQMPRERLFLRPESWYGEQNIALRMGVEVESLNHVDRVIATSEGDIGYDELVLTTGASPRRLSQEQGGGLSGVYCLRDLADIDAVAPHFREGARLVIVGGGYIGLEAAAVAAKQGVEVVLIEQGERILQRVACQQTSDFFRSLHQHHGVDIRENTTLVRLSGENHVTQAHFGDGTCVDVDFVITGIGIEPRAKLARDAGLEIEGGAIACDLFGRTSDPHIWAAGDCASFPLGGEMRRLESVQNAIDQAENVAANLLGGEVPYHPKVWFWSDQYDVKLQIAGLAAGYCDVITRGAEGRAPWETPVSFWYYRGDQLIAVDALNDPRAYMAGKRMIEGGISPGREAVADVSVSLKELMAS